ncbi:hypothetical protein T10_6281 [Trichinella papuae]|uniref:Uncharacterized protein n=1 Tax=Trichinella papuae TaxID=268474 RepID=A0A0V1LYT7_9BILA|nr:hypothetical protein T10_6281 [Trichinella papuae]
MKPKFKTIHTDKKTHQYNQCMKEVVLQSNPLSLFNVVKPLHMRVVVKGIK